MRRMIVLVTEEQHAALKRTAALAGLTLSNYVRKALCLPPEHQGKAHKITTTTADRKEFQQDVSLS